MNGLLVSYPEIIQIMVVRANPSLSPSVFPITERINSHFPLVLQGAYDLVSIISPKELIKL